MDFNDYISEGSKELNLEINKEIIEKFKIYKNLLISWNEKINLTSITDDRNVAIKHFLDSISISKYIVNKNTKLLDVGTGAGFPGIPLKILYKDLNVTLLDSLKKRVTFLQKVIDQTSINGINCIHGRAEDFGKNKNYREKFNFVTARAVARLPILIEYCLPFLELNGIFIAMKGNSDEEIKDSKKALEMLGGEIINVEKFELPYNKENRSVIIIQKQRQTPTRFPRKAGKPTSNPLI
jgi:16S rRNA (guanine527-N7)-methyltransferase